MRFAKLYDIADEVLPGYEDNGFVCFQNISQETHNRNIFEYIKNNNIQIGDILFIGSTYETRQECGFFIVDDKKKIIGSEDACYLPFANRPYEGDKNMAKILKNENVKYKNLIEKLVKENGILADLYIGKFWRDEESIEEIIDEYKKNEIWD
tara:strand:+ start:535 stop:990 length:456 start_codon:yes stop_codon:yes gene_type:complete